MTSRIKAVKKNFKHDIIAHVLTQILEFVNRVFFLKFLGEELLGLNGLFISFLTLLSIAELGIGNVFNVFLYKPLHEKDYDKITAANNYFKKAYKIIVLIISILGTLLIPFIVIFAKTSISPSNIIIFYVLYFLSVILTYFTITDQAILSSDQRHFVVSKYTSYTLIIQNILQFLVLLLFRSYYMYLLVAIIIKLMYNYLIKKYMKQNYDYLENKNLMMNKKDVSKLVSNIKDMVVYKLSCVIVSATDNILISAIINVSTVGIYSIYNLLSNALSGLFSVVSTSAVASIGNIIVSEDSDVRYRTYNRLKFIYFILTGLCCVGLYVGSFDFISLFFGSKYTFNNYILIVIIINFFITQVTRPILLYKECAGLFKEVKYCNLISAILNVILSIALGIPFGILGILAATAISKLLSTYWYEAKVLYTKVFNNKYMIFIFDSLKISFVIIISLFISSYILSIINFNGIIGFFVNETIACLIYLIFVIIFYFKDENYLYYKLTIKSKI